VHLSVVSCMKVMFYQISGGTGFAPMFQLLHHQLLANPSTTPTTRFTLMHSSRTPSELPPSQVLSQLRAFAEQHPERLRLNFFVDQPDAVPATQPDGVAVTVERITKQAVRRALGDAEPSWWSRWISTGVEPPRNRVLFLVCGPNP
jgi:cytochrome-b5 reductase